MGDDYTVDDMFVTASATKGVSSSEEKRTVNKAIAGMNYKLNEVRKRKFFKKF